MQKKQTSRKLTRAAAKKLRRRGGADTSVAVTFRHVAPSDAIRSYAERKLGHLGKYTRRACAVHAILSVDKYRHRGEVTVKSGPISVAVAEESKDLYTVIDLLVDKAVRQLKQFREKVVARKTRSTSTADALSAAEEMSV